MSCTPYDASQSCFMEMAPPEIVLHGLSFLTPIQICKMQELSKRFYEIIKNSPTLTCSRIQTETFNEMAFAASKGSLGGVELLFKMRDFLGNQAFTIADHTATMHEAIKQSNHNLIQLLIKNSQVDQRGKEAAFQWAYKNNDVEIVKFMLADPFLIDPTGNDHAAIKATCSESRLIDVFKLLIKDPRVQNPEIIRMARINAIMLENMQALEFLLIEDPSKINSIFIKTVHHQQLSMVQKLLADSRVDPSFEDNLALRTAVNQFEMVELLLQSERIQKFGEGYDLAIEGAKKSSKGKNRTKTIKLLKANRAMETNDTDLKQKIASITSKLLNHLKKK